MVWKPRGLREKKKKIGLRPKQPKRFPGRLGWPAWLASLPESQRLGTNRQTDRHQDGWERVRDNNLDLWKKETKICQFFSLVPRRSPRRSGGFFLLDPGTLAASGEEVREEGRKAPPAIPVPDLKLLPKWVFNICLFAAASAAAAAVLIIRLIFFLAVTPAALVCVGLCLCAPWIGKKRERVKKIIKEVNFFNLCLGIFF